MNSLRLIKLCVRVGVTNNGSHPLSVELGDTPIGVFPKEINLSKLTKSALLITKSTIGTTP
jgi:hypothetical protein